MHCTNFSCLGILNIELYDIVQDQEINAIDSLTAC